MTDVRLIKASANALPLDDESVQTCVTSPPYWGLRAYAGEQETTWEDGTVHALGLEPTPELYVAHMVEVFREVKRVLRPDGTLWMNLGDSYASTPPGNKTQGVSASSTLNGVNGASGRYRETLAQSVQTKRSTIVAGLKPKDLVGIPWMVAFALRADGWYLRSDIVWAKPNPMPESVTDRPTKSHEYLFLLSKSERYFYDAEAIKEPASENTHSRGTGIGKKNAVIEFGQGIKNNEDYATAINGPVTERNKRSVWTVATRPYSGAHFATYPEDLIEPCILAGSSPKACGICGAPWERVTDVERFKVSDSKRYTGNGDRNDSEDGRWESSRITLGWQPTCEHNDDSGYSTVLDPFNGSGTTGVVAVRHNRNYVGIDISDEYLDLARERINGIQRGLPWEAA